MNTPTSANNSEHGTADSALAQFASVVSHDFSAPLRHARYFSAELIASLGTNIDESQQELADNVEHSLTKMESMLASLLQYSRLMSNFNPVEDVEISDVLDVLKSRLSANPGKSAIEFKEPGQAILLTADVRQLVDLSMELIENSLKFKSDDREPSVVVSVSATDEHMQLSVADNGIGLPVQDHDFALPIFRQLDPSTEGHGVGLALVRRIVDNHNGTLVLTQGEPCGLTATAHIPLHLSR